jgi:enamine deaminase RidA (YjgF/YER057c/UK114 family)
MTVRISSGGPFEETVKYSRAVIAGPHAYVSGCTSVVDGSVRHVGDPYRQALTAFDTARRALEEGGFTLADTVRTRMYLVHARDVDAVSRAHAELFDGIMPAATMVIVAGLVNPDMLVEIEVDAYREPDGAES